MEYIFSVKDQVKQLLHYYPELRDDDDRLIANIWHRQLKKMKMQSSQCLTAVAKGLLTTPESIVRCRRKLQEELPELRGRKWEERQQRGNKIRKEITKL